MMTVSLGELATALQGVLVNGDAETHVSGFATDSREVFSGSLFLAISGAKVDGHNFVPDAMARGASAALTERPVDAPHILVPNLIEALANMGKVFRSTFSGPVVGVTGSAGKTTTKEFVAAALGTMGPVLKTVGNRNSEYTAPLAWVERNGNEISAAIEMGMRGFGQITHLAAIAQPTVGIVTNIGYAHLEMVGSREGIARAKGELIEALPDNGTAVLWQGGEFLDALRKRARCPVRTFGLTDAADCRVVDYRPLNWHDCMVTLELDGQRAEAHLPAIGRHLALNAAGAVLAAVCAGADFSAACASLKNAELPPMRMQQIAYQGADIVMDAYNASPPSVIAAIETLLELPVAGRRMAVLGEMKELGVETEGSHRMIGRALATYKIGPVVFLGAAMDAAADEYVLNGGDPGLIIHAMDTNDVADFLRSVQPGDAVLVKGSRALELEKAVQSLGIEVG